MKVDPYNVCCLLKTLQVVQMGVLYEAFKNVHGVHKRGFIFIFLNIYCLQIKKLLTNLSKLRNVLKMEF